jgi:hypothetical protein
MTFFIAIGILASILAAVLVWIVPRMFYRNAGHFASETTRLQLICEDVIDEQKALVNRQAEVNDELLRFQQQLAMLARPALLPSGGTSFSSLETVEQRFDALQRQLTAPRATQITYCTPRDEAAQMRLLRATSMSKGTHRYASTGLCHSPAAIRKNGLPGDVRRQR